MLTSGAKLKILFFGRRHTLEVCNTYEKGVLRFDPPLHFRFCIFAIVVFILICLLTMTISSFVLLLRSARAKEINYIKKQQQQRTVKFLSKNRWNIMNENFFCVMKRSKNEPMKPNVFFFHRTHSESKTTKKYVYFIVCPPSSMTLLV